MGEGDPADELLRVEALLAEPLTEAVEQFRVRRRVVITEIVDWTGESIAEEVAPDPVHRGLRHQWAVDNQLRQGLATVHTVLRAILQLRREITVGVDGRAVDEHRIGDFHLAIAELVVELGLSGIPPLAGPILVDQLDRLNLAGLLEMPQRLRLSEEGVELPELILLPLVERVVVALRALHLKPEEDLRCLGGGLDAVLVKFAREEIGGAVEPLLTRLVDTGGGDEIGDEPIVGDILRE